jgi:Rrf2 family transcriptional regulator, cysteine metabolism repressor
MKILTKNTDYAVRALIVLALNQDNFVSAREIAKKQNIPYQFLRRILQKLIQNKLITSKAGIAGGVLLTKDPSKIALLDLIKIFQGELELSDCMFRKELCPNRKTCVLRPEIKRIEETVTLEFKKLTIKKLLTKFKE